jgi:predicted transcriptional regulator
MAQQLQEPKLQDPRLEDPSNVIHTLLSDGRARTLVEIAAGAGLARDTVARCLETMASSGLRHDRQHRHHYFALVQNSGAQNSGAHSPGKTAGIADAKQFGPRDPRLRAARTCYGHFAGDLGIALSDALSHGGYIQLDDDGYRLTTAGTRLLTGTGLELATPRGSDKPFKRCLDWSWRRPHIGGELGQALVGLAEKKAWIKRGGFHARGVTVTDKGRRALHDLLDISWPLPTA